jgi:hypothetical protein
MVILISRIFNFNLYSLIFFSQKDRLFQNLGDTEDDIFASVLSKPKKEEKKKDTVVFEDPLSFFDK